MLGVYSRAHSHPVEPRPGSDGGGVHVCRRAGLAKDVALHRRKGRLGAEVRAPLQEVGAIGDAGPSDGQRRGNKEGGLQPKRSGTICRVGPDAVEGSANRGGSGVDEAGRARQTGDIGPQEAKSDW